MNADEIALLTQIAHSVPQLALLAHRLDADQTSTAIELSQEEAETVLDSLPLPSAATSEATSLLRNHLTGFINPG